MLITLFVFSLIVYWCFDKYVVMRRSEFQPKTRYILMIINGAILVAIWQLIEIIVSKYFELSITQSRIVSLLISFLVFSIIRFVNRDYKSIVA
jgi:hypothetical protein